MLGGGKNQIAAYLIILKPTLEIIRFFGHLAFCHSKMCNLYSVICNNSTITIVRLYAHKIIRSFEKVKVQI